MGRFRFGQIVWAYVSDGLGHTKERPALIISSNENNDRGDDLQVIAITKRIENPCPPFHVVVHSDFVSSPITGLDAPCVAKCNWVRDVKQHKVIRSLGKLPEDLLKQVVDNFTQLIDDQSFNGWS